MSENNENKPTDEKTDFQLSRENLMKDPKEVFDFMGKLGAGNYGQVYKAFHKEAAETVAIKVVPIEGDVTQILKVISGKLLLS